MSNVITIKTTNNNYGFADNSGTIDDNNIPTNLELGELAVSGLPDIITGDWTTLWLGMGQGNGAVPLVGYYKDAKEEQNPKYLPITGGTMMGNINLGTNRWLEGTTTSGGIFSILGLIDPTRFQVGGSYPSLELKGKDERPTYNGSEVALYSDIQAYVETALVNGAW